MRGKPMTKLTTRALRLLAARGAKGGTAKRLDIGPTTAVALVARGFATRRCFDGIRDTYYVTPQGLEAAGLPTEEGKP